MRGAWCCAAGVVVVRKVTSYVTLLWVGSWVGVVLVVEVGGVWYMLHYGVLGDSLQCDVFVVMMIELLFGIIACDIWVLKAIVVLNGTFGDYSIGVKVINCGFLFGEDYLFGMLFVNWIGDETLTL